MGYLSLIERDLATPSIKSLHAVSRALGVTIGWFFETGDPPRPSGTSSSAARACAGSNIRLACWMSF